MKSPLKKRLAKGSLALAIVLGLLAVVLYLVHQWRLEAVPVRPLLPVAFEHIDHVEEPCAECHHNFIDDTGGGACYNCHKMDPEINFEMEPMFHDYCWGCHIERAEAGEDSGPLRSCKGCHP